MAIDTVFLSFCKYTSISTYCHLWVQQVCQWRLSRRHISDFARLFFLYEKNLSSKLRAYSKAEEYVSELFLDFKLSRFSFSSSGEKRNNARGKLKSALRILQDAPIITKGIDCLRKRICTAVVSWLQVTHERFCFTLTTSKRIVPLRNIVHSVLCHDFGYLVILRWLLICFFFVSHSGGFRAKWWHTREAILHEQVLEKDLRQEEQESFRQRVKRQQSHGIIQIRRLSS